MRNIINISIGVVLAGLLAACSRSDESTPVLSSVNQSGPPYDETPRYAFNSGDTADDRLTVNWCYQGDPNLYVGETQTFTVDEMLDEDPGADGNSTSFTTAVPVQGAAVGVTSVDAPYLVLVLTDYATNESRIEIWKDSDADGLPDDGSVTVLDTLSPCHLVQATLDSSTGTLYVADPLNQRVYRYGDNNGDLVPDVAAKSVFLQEGGAGGATLSIRQLDSPEEWSVAVRQYETMKPHGDPWNRATDADENEVADTMENNETTWPDQILGVLLSGETTLEVSVQAGKTYRIEAVDGGTATVLATFDGVAEDQDVALGAALVAGDFIRIMDDVANESVASAPVIDAGLTWLGDLEDLEITLIENGSLTWKGANITGNELVTAQLAWNTEPNWISVPIQDWQSDSLTIEIPEFQLSSAAPVTFRVETTDGREIAVTYWIEPDSGS